MGNGKCDSCGDFCKTCSTDSPGTCEDCIANWINQDGVCYQEACTLPEDLEDTFTGVDMGGGETCQNEGNLEPSASCKVVCADGSYSSDPDKTGDVFTCGAEPGDDGSWPFDAQPDIVCTACSESADENCKTCPGGDCTAFLMGTNLKPVTNLVKSSPVQTKIWTKMLIQNALSVEAPHTAQLVGTPPVLVGTQVPAQNVHQPLLIAPLVKKKVGVLNA